MDRRSFLKTTGAVAGAAAVPAGATAAMAGTDRLTAPSPSISTRTLRVACDNITRVPGVDLLVQQFGETLARISDAKLQVAASGTDGEPLSSGGVGQLAAGEADIVFSLNLRPAGDASHAIGGHDLFGFVPFGFDSAQYHSWLSAGGGQLLWDAALAPYDIKPLPVASLQTSGHVWLTETAGAGSDGLSGRRIVAPALAAAMLQSVGVSTIDIGEADLDTALAGRKADGTLAQTALADHGRGLAASGGRRFASTFARGALPLAAGIRRAFWETLSASEREMISLAALQAGQYFAAAHFAQEAMVARMLEAISDHSLAGSAETRAFSPALETRLGEASLDTLASLSARDISFRRALDCQTGFRDLLSAAGGKFTTGV